MKHKKLRIASQLNELLDHWELLFSLNYTCRNLRHELKIRLETRIEHEIVDALDPFYFHPTQYNEEADVIGGLTPSK